MSGITIHRDDPRAPTPERRPVETSGHRGVRRTVFTPGARTLTALVASFALVVGACESDPTGPSGACEIIYATTNPPGPSGIEVHNRTGGGLSVQVDSNSRPGAGADMAAGACEVWAYPAGTYSVTLQRCRQDVAGSSECTAPIGASVVRSVRVDGGSRTAIRVDSSFFP